ASLPERTASRTPMLRPLSQRTLDAPTAPAAPPGPASTATAQAASAASSSPGGLPASTPSPAPSSVAGTPDSGRLPESVVASAPPPPESAPSAALPTESVPPPVAVATAPTATPRDETEVRATLGRYAAAYQDLDADAAQLVWPSVDARALSRAFSGLESQSLEFGRCDLDVRATVARADCQGRATYVRRVGSRTPQSVSRMWSFQLRKVDGTWQIVEATT